MSQKNKLCGDGSSRSFDEDDMENSSIMGQKARSSVRGAMSDWDGADSTVGGASPRTHNILRIVGETGGGHHQNNVEQNSMAATGAGDDETEVGGGAKSLRGGSSVRILRWWSGVVSRVSRSASSILSQNTPNLNDILDGTGDLDNPIEPPRRGVQDSIPENDPCGPPVVEDGNNNNEQEVFALRAEVALLKKKMQELEEEREQSNPVPVQIASSEIDDIPSITPAQLLQSDQISRYSRQLLLNDGFGVSGQKELLSSSILVIGAGGIGSTVLMYLAAAGVGHITIVDYDCVEMSNLHRQVIHKDENAAKSYDQVGMNKALSAKEAMLALNPSISCTALSVMISAENALELVSKHDVVVDACDNPRTRYLLNDACILAGKTLVSGSAMGTEGQLTVYNYQPTNIADESDQPKKKRTACYRCLYPNPNPAEGCKSCSDNGVLGMVPGAIGILQAVEAIKVVTGIGSIMHDRLLMYDSLHCSFLNIKKPPARPKCAVCSEHSTIKTMKDSAESLENVRGPSVCDMPTPGNLSEEQNVSCVKYNEVRENNQPHILLDVRVPRQFELCALEGSVNLPLEELESKLGEVEELSKGELPVYCLCRRGIASAEATRIIQRLIDDGDKTNGIHSVYNIAGGLNSWVRTVDTEFPQY